MKVHVIFFNQSNLIMKIHIYRLISCIWGLLIVLAFADYLAFTQGFSSPVILFPARMDKSIKNMLMKKLFILLLSLFITAESMAQQSEQLIIKPICKIHITTVHGNMLKGLLLLTYDSVVIIYPGKRQEWNRNKEYRTAIYGYSKIKIIVIKKNGRVMKGIAIGAAIGSLPLFTGLSKNEKASLAGFSAITIPAGMIAGAVFGFASQRKFQINASDSLFHEFQNQIQ
ncbi:MAG: hypothetical protein ABI675_09970 [Chitinophagaceae bacterium]